jgi:UDP-N-acetylglucosamine acyltransferase
MSKISKLSSVDPRAELAADVEVGPFCLVGADVVVGSGCKLLRPVVLAGHTKIGKNNVFHANSVIGGLPQDKKYRDDPTRLEIGDGNVFREGVTANIGTDAGGGCTYIGSDSLFMANSHIGHDARIGDDCVLANNCMIAGHVVCGNHVNMMGGVGVHHFVSIGDYVYVGGAARIHHDVPPYVKVDGADKIRGVNTVGLMRAGFSAEDIEEIEQACRKLFYGRKPLAHVMAEFDKMNGVCPHVRNVVEFIRRRDLGKHGRYLESFRKDGN